MRYNKKQQSKTAIDHREWEPEIESFNQHERTN